jgi:hypothetical protein
MHTRFLCLLLLITAGPAFAAAQIEDFSYQGHLDMNGAPANGAFPMIFSLFDAPSGGNLVGTPRGGTVNVTGGTFAVPLGYPGAFNGTQLYLQINVNGQVLPGRQPILAAPVAQFSLNGGRKLAYTNTSPSTDPNAPGTLLNTVGPFSIRGNCLMDAATQAVKAVFNVYSTDHYNYRLLANFQLNDTGPITPFIQTSTNVTDYTPAIDNVTPGNYVRAWYNNLILYSRDSDVTVTINAYVAADARAASTGCIIEGVATLGQ